MATKTYVKLKDASTTLFDFKTKTSITGKKPLEVEVTQLISNAIAKGVLIQLSEKDYKIALDEWGKTHAVTEKPNIPVKPVAPPATPPKDEDDKKEEGKEEGDENPPAAPEVSKEEFEKKLATLKGEELLALANKKGVSTEGLKTKAEIIAKLVAELYK